MFRPHNQERSLFHLLDLRFWKDEDLALYDDDAVRKVVLGNPNAVKCKYEFNGSHGSVYPLPWAVKLGALRPTVEFMYDAHPEAIREKDCGGWTPLHYACSRKASRFDVVRFLIDAHPEAVEQADDAGWTPLHLACSVKAPLEVVAVLVERCPSVIEMEDRRGDTPLSWYLECARGSARLEVVRLLLGERCHHRSILATKGRWGRTPLHIACDNRAPFQVLEFLAERYPDVLGEKDGDGNTPIQLAERTSSPLEVRTLLHTIHTIRCLNASDDEVTSMLQESTAMEWRSRVIPILHSRSSLVPKLEIGAKLMPTLLERVGREGKVQTTFLIIRESMETFKGLESNEDRESLK